MSGRWRGLKKDWSLGIGRSPIYRAMQLAGKGTSLPWKLPISEPLSQMCKSIRSECRQGQSPGKITDGLMTASRKRGLDM